MLCAAGIEHEAIASAVDEDVLKAGYSDPVELTSELASAKALSVSRASPEDWIIGSDSIVCIDSKPFDKPSSRGAAEEHLRLFSGKSMQLTSAVALARAGEVDWVEAKTATLKVRPLSGDFIQSYLDAEWP